MVNFAVMFLQLSAVYCNINLLAHLLITQNK